MSQLSISQILAELQDRIAGLPDESIIKLAREQGRTFIVRHSNDPDRIERAINETLRQAAGGMPSRELLTFVADFGAELRLIWHNRNSRDVLVRRSMPHPSQLALGRETGADWRAFKGEVV